MKGYTGDTIRNVALLGHGGCGKTTFLEAALLATGVINRLGKVEDGNTVSDYDKMEIEKGYSISLSIVPVEYNKTKINFIDTPGFFDFIGEVDSAMRAVDAAMILVDASSGIQVGTEKAWNSCKQYNMPKMFVITKTDKENVNVEQTIADLKAKFGTSVVTLDDKDALTEAIAETDEELMEKYFGGEEFTEEEFARGLLNGIAGGSIVPILTCCSMKNEGITEVLEAAIKYLPKAGDHVPYKTVDDKEIACDPSGKPVGFVFKTIADPFLGKINLVKVVAGKLSNGMELYNSRAEKTEKIASIFYLRGKNQSECPSAVAGDIVAIAKLQFAQTGDTLSEKASAVELPGGKFPFPVSLHRSGAEDKRR